MGVQAGVHHVELRKSGVTARQLRKAGLSARHLHSAGFTASELREIGVTIDEFRTSGFMIAELRDAGFTALQLQALDCAMNELSSLFELVTIHVASRGSDGLLAVSCFGVGGLEAATVHIPMCAGCW